MRHFSSDTEIQRRRCCWFILYGSYFTILGRV